VVQGVLEGLRPAVVALIASAGLGILTLALWGEKGISSGLGDINITAVILVVLSIFALRKWKPNPIFVIIGTGFIGMIIYLNI
jgi:chromate transporter